MGGCGSRDKEDEMLDDLDAEIAQVVSYLRENNSARRELLPILSKCAAETSVQPLSSFATELSANKAPRASSRVCINAFSPHAKVSDRSSDLPGSTANRSTFGSQRTTQSANVKLKFSRIMNKHRAYKAFTADNVQRNNTRRSSGTSQLSRRMTSRMSRQSTSEESIAEAPMAHDDWRYRALQSEKYIAEKSYMAASTDTHPMLENGATMEHLYSFVPKVIKHLIAQKVISFDDFLRTQSVEEFSPFLTSFDAVVVFADASGFTKMTESLAKQIDGAEKIGACLNGFFRPVIEVADMFGADILKFSGDALTMIWPASEVLPTDAERSSTHSTQSRMSKAICIALECCAALHNRVKDGSKRSSIQGHIESDMCLHIGVGCGNISVLQVGGLLNRWEFLITGKPLDQISIAEPLASREETVISPEVAAFLWEGDGETLVSDRWNLAAIDQGCFRVECNKESTQQKHLVPPIMFDSSHATRTVEDPDPEQWDMLDARLLGRFIPYACWRTFYKPQSSQSVSRGTRRSVAQASPKVRISPPPHGMARCLPTLADEESYLEEMRLASVVFVNIEGLTDCTMGPDSAVIQTIVGLIQRAAYSQEGSLNKCLLDDKGFLILCCFGLPPLNHVKDDALRATLFSLRLMEMLQEEEGIVARAGVTTGLLWCGVVGSPIRREYTVLGDVVNLSARLMSSAAPNQVVVCENTYQGCRKVLAFGEQRTIRVKGKEQPLVVRSPTGSLYTGDVYSMRSYLTLSAWQDWGLPVQIDQILQKALSCGMVTISGEAGCGKGAALELIKQWAKAKNFVCLHGHNVAAGGTFTAPLQPWRSICSTMVEHMERDPAWKQRVDKKQRKWTLGQRKTTRASVSALYQLLCCMLEYNGSGDRNSLVDRTSLIPWLPLAAMVIPSFAFNSEIVQSMRDADLDYSHTSRFGELVSALVEAFSAKPPAPYEGTVIICHHHKGTSFHDVPNPHARTICDAVADLSLRRDKNNAPLIFVFISREGGEHKYLLESSRLTDTNLELGNLSRRNAHLFIGHYFAAWMCSKSWEYLDASAEDKSTLLKTCAKQILFDLPIYVFEYIYDMSHGNMKGMEVLNQHFIDKKVVQIRDDNLEIASDFASREALNAIEVPMELYGMFVSTFEKLSADEQIIIKTAVMFDEAFSVDDLIAFLPSMTVSELCHELVRKNIFKEVRCREVSSRTSECTSSPASKRYTVESILLRRVANNLVLRSQQLKSKLTISIMRENRSDAGSNFKGSRISQITHETRSTDVRESTESPTRRRSSLDDNDVLLLKRSQQQRLHRSICFQPGGYELPLGM